MQYPEAHLTIFARTPVPGQVKTRLIPLLGEKGACHFYQRMSRFIIDRLLHDKICHYTLACSPDCEHSFFQSLAAKKITDNLSVRLSCQRGDDLGQRMSHAISDALASSNYALVMGTDAPSMDSADIQQAISELKQGHDMVIIPAEDGGYTLIGMSRHYPSLFQNINWSTDQVFQQTIKKAEDLSLSVSVLTKRWDIDRPDDLERLAKHNVLNLLLKDLEIQDETPGT